MLVPTLIMAFLAALLLAAGLFRGQGEHLVGLRVSYAMTLQILPLLFFAFVVAGMVQTLIPQETVARWVGDEAGLRGILVGTIAGGFTPGGPFVSLPIAAGLLRSGAGMGTMVAFITGWSLLAFARLPMEVGILGLRFTVIRLASTFFLPFLAGLFAHFFFGKFQP